MAGGRRRAPRRTPTAARRGPAPRGREAGPRAAARCHAAGAGAGAGEDPARDLDVIAPAPVCLAETVGGSVTAGIAIYDTMQYVKPAISTICMGQAASMGALLLCAGTKGKRFALPHARILIHQPLGGVQGQATDIDIQAKEILRMREELNRILAHHTRCFKELSAACFSRVEVAGCCRSVAA